MFGKKGGQGQGKDKGDGKKGAEHGVDVGIGGKRDTEGNGRICRRRLYAAEVKKKIHGVHPHRRHVQAQLWQMRHDVSIDVSRQVT